MQPQIPFCILEILQVFNVISKLRRITVAKVISNRSQLILYTFRLILRILYIGIQTHGKGPSKPPPPSPINSVPPFLHHPPTRKSEHRQLMPTSDTPKKQSINSRSNKKKFHSPRLSPHPRAPNMASRYLPPLPPSTHHPAPLRPSLPKPQTTLSATQPTN